MSEDDIGNAGIRFYPLLHSPTCTLQQIRKHKYDAMVASDRSKIDPAILPPSPRAAFYHGLRVYHQVMVRKELSDVDNDPLRWGWTMRKNIFAPIMTDLEAARDHKRPGL